jgi:hypothetical protein
VCSGLQEIGYPRVTNLRRRALDGMTIWMSETRLAVMERSSAVFDDGWRDLAHPMDEVLSHPR